MENSKTASPKTPMSSIASRIRRLIPLGILERFYLAYWRQHKEQYATALDKAQVLNLNITQNAYARRSEFYKKIHDEAVRNEAIVYLEFGVFQGESILCWADLNKNPDSLFYGFDTFEGLPEDWKDYSAGHFSTAGHLPETQDSRVTFVPGLFQATLDRTLAQFPKDRRWVLHIDSDLYSAALYILTRLHDHLRPGTIILFDQWVDIHEYRALHDYCQAYGTRMTLFATMNDRFSKVAFRVVD